MCLYFKIIAISFLGFSLSCTSPSGNDSDAARPELVQITSKDEKSAAKKTILIFGNSLTAGFGLEADESFPARLQQRIDSLKLPYKVVNAGVSGETTATGLSRIDWVLEKQDVDIFVLELGANDGLRGLPPLETQNNLVAMINKVQNTYPKAKIILAGMMVPPSMGEDYSDRYKRIYPEIAEQENIMLIPFLLQEVGGISTLNQNDGIHPNAQGARLVADNVWQVLGPLLKK